MTEKPETHFLMETADDGTVALRLSHAAKEEFKTVQWIEMPQVGKTVGMNEALIAIESTKAIFELESPLTGDILEVKISPEAPLELLIRIQPTVC